MNFETMPNFETKKTERGKSEKKEVKTAEEPEIIFGHEIEPLEKPADKEKAEIVHEVEPLTEGEKEEAEAIDIRKKIEGVLKANRIQPETPAESIIIQLKNQLRGKCKPKEEEKKANEILSKIIRYTTLDILYPHFKHFEKDSSGHHEKLIEILRESLSGAAAAVFEKALRRVLHKPDWEKTNK